MHYLGLQDWSKVFKKLHAAQKQNKNELIPKRKE